MMKHRCGRFALALLLGLCVVFATAKPAAAQVSSRQFLREAWPTWQLATSHSLVRGYIMYRQVQLMAQIVQINRFTLATLGIDWRLSDTDQAGGGGDPGTAAEPPADPAEMVEARAYQFASFYQSLSDLTLQVTLAALGARQDVGVLSQPRIATVSGGRGYILAGRDVPLISNLPVFPMQGADAAIGTIDTGLQLDVQPIITADRRYVTLHVNPSITLNLNLAAAGQGDGAGSVQLPPLGLRSVSTTVSVPDGGTLLLGGQQLTTRSEGDSGGPRLSRIPLLGQLFGQDSAARDERTLLILVKPTIIIQEEEPGGAVASQGGDVGHADHAAALAEADAAQLLRAAERARQRDAAAPGHGWGGLADALAHAAANRAADPESLALAMRLLLADPAVVELLGGEGDFALSLGAAGGPVDSAIDAGLRLPQAALLTAGVHLADVRHATVPTVTAQR